MIPSLKVKNKEDKMKLFSLNRRQRTLLTILIATIFLLSVVIVGALLDKERIATNLNCTKFVTIPRPFFWYGLVRKGYVYPNDYGAFIKYGSRIDWSNWQYVNCSYPWYGCSNNGENGRSSDFVAHRPFSKCATSCNPYILLPLRWVEDLKVL